MPAPFVSWTVISSTPGALGLHTGSTRAKRYAPAGVGLSSGSWVGGVNVGPSVGVGVFVAGWMMVGVAVGMVGVGAGVLVFRKKLAAQLVAPWLLASSIMLRTAVCPVLVLIKLV